MALELKRGFTTVELAVVLIVVVVLALALVPILRSQEDAKLEREVKEFIEALRILSQGATPPEQGAPVLIAGLAYSEEEVRDNAAEVLVRLGVDYILSGAEGLSDGELFFGLSAALQHESARIRESAARALGTMGEGATAAFPELIDATRDDSAVCGKQPSRPSDVSGKGLRLRLLRSSKH